MSDTEMALLDFKGFKSTGYGHSNLPSSWSIELAILAMQEKLERENGCKCWDESQKEAWMSTGATYCQQCGCKLKGNN